LKRPVPLGLVPDPVEGVGEAPRSRLSNHTGRLILAPRDPQACPDRDRLSRALSEAGFIADPIADQEAAFHVGPEFLGLIAFVGCAVAITSDPVCGGPFCHVVVPPAALRPCFCHGRNTRAPRCPSCRGRLSDWQSQIENGASRSEAGIACPSCGKSHPMWSWDWKQQAGFARQIIQVEEIFPGEAVPTRGLLDLLEQTSGCVWLYFYVQD
jgi:hypothetical protein